MFDHGLAFVLKEGVCSITLFLRCFQDGIFHHFMKYFISWAFWFLQAIRTFSSKINSRKNYSNKAQGGKGKRVSWGERNSPGGQHNNARGGSSAQNSLLLQLSLSNSVTTINQPALCPASPQHRVGTLLTDITSQLVQGTSLSTLQILLTDRNRSSCISFIYLMRSLSRSSISPSQQGRQTKAVCAWKQQPFHGNGEMGTYPLQKEGSPGTWPPLLSLGHRVCI